MRTNAKPHTNRSNARDPVRVGVAGLGRSGWNIHAAALAEMTDQFRIVAVTDSVPARLDEARTRFACRTHSTLDGLVADPAVEVVIVATPNDLHTAHTMTALQAGKHVVCEKPLALSSEDADRMIDAAASHRRVLAPFQNRRYEAHFRQVQEVIDSGVLGRIVQIRMTWHAFTRRWDWQTLREFGGGLLNNNGSHLVDQALLLLGDDVEPEIFADLQRALSSGDAEDHVKIVLRAEGRPTIDVELTNACAYPQDRWLIMGTSGGLRGTLEELQWQWVDWSSLPDRAVERTPTPDRQYNRESLTWHQASWRKPDDWPGEHTLFYRDLFNTLRCGKPFPITPQSVRRRIAVLEACHMQVAASASLAKSR